MSKKILFLMTSSIISAAFFMAIAAVSALSIPSAVAVVVASDTPTLTFSLDASTPASKSIAIGEKDVEVIRFKMAVTGENIKVSSLTMGNSIGLCNFSNLKLINPVDSIQVGSTVASASLGEGGTCKAQFDNLNFTVPAGSTKILTLKLSLSPYAVAGDQFAFGVLGSYIPLLASGKIISVEGVPVGNTMTVEKTVSSGLTITTTSLPSGTVGVVYSTLVSATGGNGYAWSVSGLPTGLSSGNLACTGSCQNAPLQIHGTPTIAGTYTVTITVTSGTQSVSKQFSLVISETGTPTPTLTPTPAPTPTSDCLPDNTLVKMPDDPKVYAIINCQKKWIQTADEFKQEGYKWTDVKEVNSPVVQAYTDYQQATTNLLKAIGQNRIYKVVNDKLLWVPTISAFNAQGLKWSDVQSVDTAQLSKYQRVKLVQASGDPKVYYITESGLKRHIPNEAVFNSYNNKWGDVVTVDAAVVNSYPDANLVKAEDGYQVYKLENGQKRWIKTDAAFKRLKLDWNKVVPVNSTELAAYPDGSAIE